MAHGSVLIRAADHKPVVQLGLGLKKIGNAIEAVGQFLGRQRSITILVNLIKRFRQQSAGRLRLRPP